MPSLQELSLGALESMQIGGVGNWTELSLEKVSIFAKFQLSKKVGCSVCLFLRSFNESQLSFASLELCDIRDTFHRGASAEESRFIKSSDLRAFRSAFVSSLSLCLDSGIDCVIVCSAC